MGKPLSLCIASTLIEPVRRAFDDAFDVDFDAAARGAEMPLADWLKASDGVFDAVVFSLDVPMPAATIEALPSTVRALATYSVGTDHIDLEAARGRGLAVFNTPGVLANSVAENAIFLMLGAARRATENIELLRSRNWKGWNPTQVLGVELAGRTLGVLGLGDIGRRIASRAEALGMKIHYCNRNPHPEAKAKGWAYRSSAAELVADCDVLMVACPSTAETRGLVDAALLRRARPGLIVVNIARGDIVEDDALIGALEKGQVRAAGLDVFAGEPDVDARYFERPTVFMLPHIGSSTEEARMGMGRILIEALEQFAEADRGAGAHPDRDAAPIANRVV